MADFFTFLQTFVQSFLYPLTGMMNNGSLAVWLGAPLLIILLGFWLVRMIYNIFISHRDSLGASNYSVVARARYTGSSRSAARSSATYSSAYANRPYNTYVDRNGNIVNPYSD